MCGYCQSHSSLVGDADGAGGVIDYPLGILVARLQLIAQVALILCLTTPLDGQLAAVGIRSADENAAAFPARPMEVPLSSKASAPNGSSSPLGNFTWIRMERPLTVGYFSNTTEPACGATRWLVTASSTSVEVPLGSMAIYSLDFQ